MIHDDSAARRAACARNPAIAVQARSRVAQYLEARGDPRGAGGRPSASLPAIRDQARAPQLPQYYLELGRGMAGLIAHTQPRRLAARALASRLAEELGQAVGRSVGFRVRFADQVSDATRLVS